MPIPKEPDGEYTSCVNALRRVENNDPTLPKLCVGVGHPEGDAICYFKNNWRFESLGRCIGQNTNLKCLSLNLYDEKGYDAMSLRASDTGFYEGLQSNTSIEELLISCEDKQLGSGSSVVRNTLNEFQKNGNLVRVYIEDAWMVEGGGNELANLLKNSNSIESFTLKNSPLSGLYSDELPPLIEGIKGHATLKELHLCGDYSFKNEGCSALVTALLEDPVSSLKVLDLSGNKIDNDGCDALATLLGNPNCNLQSLNLRDNEIEFEGLKAIANGLSKNKKLQVLIIGIYRNHASIFSRLLCDKSSINQTYLSNHTLQNLGDGRYLNLQLPSLLALNKKKNKSHVAILKILKSHPNIDMEPLFEWEEEGEQTLKAMPHVVAWFERAEGAVEKEDDRGSYNITQKKLSAIIQFAKAMPVLFEGIATMDINN